ncbi:MAG: hypothetical protein AABZ47_11700 [Planctomycetota bacterium]
MRKISYFQKLFSFRGAMQVLRPPHAVFQDGFVAPQRSRNDRPEGESSKPDSVVQPEPRMVQPVRMSRVGDETDWQQSAPFSKAIVDPQSPTPPKSSRRLSATPGPDLKEVESSIPALKKVETRVLASLSTYQAEASKPLPREKIAAPTVLETVSRRKPIASAIQPSPVRIADRRIHLMPTIARADRNAPRLDERPTVKVDQTAPSSIESEGELRERTTASRDMRKTPLKDSETPFKEAIKAAIPPRRIEPAGLRDRFVAQMPVEQPVIEIGTIEVRLPPSQRLKPSSSPGPPAVRLARGFFNPFGLRQG